MDIVLNNVTKTYGKNIIAVNNINLKIISDEFTVLLGPSGCGKTTSLRMIAGLENIDEGEIYFGNKIVNYVPPKDRNIAMVFQGFSLYPNMNIFDNIGFSLEVQKRSKQEIIDKVNEVSKVVGISHLLERIPSQVSGGEAQRCALARTLVRKTDVLLMDEPLSNLDAKLRIQLRAELKRLHQEFPRTTVYVTHDQEEAMTLGDKIVVMNNGNIQQLGTPKEIYFNPSNLFVAEFVGTPSMNFFKCEVLYDKKVYLKTNDFVCEIKYNEKYLNYKSVILGVRPDMIKISENQDKHTVTGVIDVVEMLGNRQLIYIKFGSNIITSLVDSSSNYLPGDKINLFFELSDLYLFDPHTEQNINTI